MLIALENLTRNYRMGEQSVQALAGINLEIDAGDFVAISGPSGSGKSTLLHIIGGLDSPTSGKVLVEGRNLSRASGNELAAYRNRRIGFVFQSFHLHPTYNSLENVALPLIFAGMGGARRKKLAQKALEDVGLARRIRHRPNELSGGVLGTAAAVAAGKALNFVGSKPFLSGFPGFELSVFSPMLILGSSRSPPPSACWQAFIRLTGRPPLTRWTL